MNFPSQKTKFISKNLTKGLIDERNKYNSFIFARLRRESKSIIPPPSYSFDLLSERNESIEYASRKKNQQILHQSEKTFCHSFNDGTITLPIELEKPRSTFPIDKTHTHTRTERKKENDE